MQKLGKHVGGKGDDKGQSSYFSEIDSIHLPESSTYFKYMWQSKLKLFIVTLLRITITHPEMVCKCTKVLKCKKSTLF